MLNTEDNEDHIQSPDRWICTIDEMRPEWSTFDYKGFSKLYMTERGHPLRGATKWRPHAQTYAFKLSWVNFRLSKVNQRDVLEINLSMRSTFRPTVLLLSLSRISPMRNRACGHVRTLARTSTTCIMLWRWEVPYAHTTRSGKHSQTRLTNEENMSLTYSILP